MSARCHKARDMGHVDHEVSAVVVRDLGDALEIDDARICRGASHDELGLVFLGFSLDVGVVDALVFAKAVGNHVVQLAREVGGRTVSEVAAVVEAHAQNGVARLDERRIGSVVGLSAGMRLHVGELRAEKLLGALDRQVLDDVDLLAAAVVALARVTLGVLVGKNAAHGLHDGRRDDVLGSDQLDGAALTRKLLAQSLGNFGVGGCNVLQSHRDSSFAMLTSTAPTRRAALNL